MAGQCELGVTGLATMGANLARNAARNGYPVAVHNRTGSRTREPAEVFERWNAGDLDSFLIEITAKVLRQVDQATGRPLVDLVLDQAEQKGTGRWTVQSALELGVPVTGITEAVFARVLSSQRDQRTAAAKVLQGPSGRLDAARADRPGTFHTLWSEDGREVDA
jgi:6-phosphogluconate dehydrogenase